MDVTDDASVGAAAKTIETDGGLDVLVNNAGIEARGADGQVPPPAETSADLVRTVFTRRSSRVPRSSSGWRGSARTARPAATSMRTARWPGNSLWPDSSWWRDVSTRRRRVRMAWLTCHRLCCRTPANVGMRRPCRGLILVCCKQVPGRIERTRGDGISESPSSPKGSPGYSGLWGGPAVRSSARPARTWSRRPRF
ncbi:hypothetical protein MXD95_011180 [Frankia sp. AiPa1]|nr:hypothetical protein [Frankia sp. AiPa1]MCL9759794.1 hypothetical protein [Frankia sp. AiPa1]